MGKAGGLIAVRDEEGASPYDEAILTRFWRYVALCQHGFACRECCWLWQGAKQAPPAGPYGRFFPTSRTHIRAHRFMWEMVHETRLPRAQFVCHNCPDGDNPSCVNPAHLFLGTHLDNMRDRQNKGRTQNMRGENHWGAKLCAADVYALRRAAKQLALRYGITVGTLSSIITRQKWKHLPEEEDILAVT